MKFRTALLCLLLFGPVAYTLGAQDTRNLYGQTAPSVLYLRHELYIDASKSMQTALWKRLEAQVKAPFLGSYLPIASGSGFWVDDHGLAVTNRHVVEVAGVEELRNQAKTFLVDAIDTLKASFSASERDKLKLDLDLLLGRSSYRFSAFTGKTFLGVVEVVSKGASDGPDLAVVRVAGASGVSLPLLPDTEVGDALIGGDVFSLGYPLGETLDAFLSERVVTMNRGGVSAFRVTTELDVQHTAAISHGNSGGPLVNGRGQVVGVNTAGLSQAQGNSLFYAISSKRVRAFLSTTKAPGSVLWNDRLAAINQATSIGLERNAQGEVLAPSLVVLDVPATVRSNFDGKALASGLQTLQLTKDVTSLELTDAGVTTNYQLRLTPGFAGPGVLKPVRSTLSAVTFSSQPAGARVLADGRDLGKTPLTVQLPPGTYQIALALEGTDFVPTSLAVIAGAPNAVSLAGRPAHRVSVVSPIGLDRARLRFSNGDEVRSFEGASNIALPDGTYGLSISDVVGFGDRPIAVTVAGADQTLDLNSAVDRIRLTIRGYQPGGVVTVDRSLAEVGSDGTLLLPAGLHLISGTRAGWTPLFVTPIHVTPGRDVFVTWKPKEGLDSIAQKAEWAAMGLGALSALVVVTGMAANQDAVALSNTKTYADYASFKNSASWAVDIGLILGGIAGLSEAWSQSQMKEFRLQMEALKK